MAGVAFELQHLSKVYRTGEVEVHALGDVTLMFEESHFTVLLGLSGSGKQQRVAIARAIAASRAAHQRHH